MNAWDFAFRGLDGGELPLDQYRGKVLLVVNTASQCGLTPQYEGLVSLDQTYRDRGLVVIGVPSNDFAGQEPGTSDQIRDFCTTRFAVGFPMAGKESVVGEKAHPFYRWLVGQAGQDAAPRWNFHKVLIGRRGEIAGVFSSRTAPLDPSVVAGIKTALAGAP